MHQHRHEGDRYRRIELITGTTRRRRWSAEEKATVVAESLKPGINVSAVARRWGVNRGLLQTWRREAMRGAETPVAAFVPIRLADGSPAGETGVPADISSVPSSLGLAASLQAPGTIEIEGTGLRVRFSGTVDVGALRAVLAHVGRRS